MKNLIFSFSFTLLLIITVSFFYTRHKIKKMEVKQSNLSVTKELLTNSLFGTVIYGGVGIEKYISTMEGKIRLADIVSGNTLVVRIHESACMPCLERELKHISMLESQMPVLIFASYSNERSLKAVLQLHNVRSKAYLLLPHQKLFPFEGNVQSLYVCILTETLEPRHLFFPVQHEDNLSEMYYRSIITLYQDKQQ